MQNEKRLLANVERGAFFKKKEYDNTEIFSYEEIKEKLPEPVLSSRPAWIACYDYAVKTLFSHICKPEKSSGFVSNFVDSAFNEDIFFNDTAIMTLFCNLLHPYVPGICSLDNFYCKQFDDGEIPREFVRASGEDFLPWINKFDSSLYSYFHNHYGFRKLRELGELPFEEMYKPNMGRIIEKTPYLTLDNLNHPLAAFAELESYWHTRDLDRLDMVIEPLYQYYKALHYHIRHQNGLYVTDWASMDNSPRNKHLGFAVDTSCEMVLFAENLSAIMQILCEEGRKVERFEERRDELARQRKQLIEKINSYMWSDTHTFYYDVTFGMKHSGIKTIAGFYPLLAGAATKQQAEGLKNWLEDEKSFKRIHRCPSLAADESGYDPNGGYWRGAVWASTNVIVTKGLEKYGYYDLAREIALNHLDAVTAVFQKTGTIWENYSPDELTSGDSDHAEFVGISGIGPILYLLEYGVGLSISHQKELLVKWNISEPLLEEGCIGCKRYWFAGKTADFYAGKTGKGLQVIINTEDEFKLEIKYKGKEYYIPVDGSIKKILEEE